MVFNENIEPYEQVGFSEKGYIHRIPYHKDTLYNISNALTEMIAFGPRFNK